MKNKRYVNYFTTRASAGHNLYAMVKWDDVAKSAIFVRDFMFTPDELAKW